MSWKNRAVSSKSVGLKPLTNTRQQRSRASNMRSNRQTRRAVVMAVVQTMLKNSRATDAFSAIASKHSTSSMETGVHLARARAGGCIHLARARAGGCRPAGEGTRCVKREASATSSNESYGGAEGVAQRLAEGGDGGAAGVFYNRVGAINRDLSILMANVLAEERSREGSKRKKRKARRLLSAPCSSPVDHPVDETGAEGEGDTRADGVVGSREQSPEELRLEGTKGDEDEGMAVLDAFAASGVRALRCA